MLTAQGSEQSDWLALTSEPIPINEVYDWCLRPSCGAVALFSGTVRDHAGHRTGVTEITYEAYESQVEPRLADIAAEMRGRWHDLGALAMIHRMGTLFLSESSVVVAVSAPHRAEAFEAARFGIDALKATVPIWKQEVHDAGSDWGLASTEIVSVREMQDSAKASVAKPKAEATKPKASSAK